MKMCNMHTGMDYVLDRLLAPIARLLVGWGILFPIVAMRLKRHYVQAASTAARKTGNGKVTDSRISVLTGLQRRDITTLREALPARPDPASNLLSRLVAQWQVRPGYSKEGRALSIEHKGPPPSFDALAADIRRDVHPRTMLDMLLAAGTVMQDQDGRLTLVETAYRPLTGSVDQLTYLADNLGDHMLAAVENVMHDPPPHFERAVHYNGLTQTDVAQLEAHFRTRQMEILQELNQIAAKMQKKAGAKGTMRLRAGGYFYSQNKAEL